MNLEIYNFKQTMVDTINDSNLPVGIVLEIMQNLIPELEKVFMNEVSKELNKEHGVDTYEDFIDFGDVSELKDEAKETTENE